MFSSGLGNKLGIFLGKLKACDWCPKKDDSHSMEGMGNSNGGMENLNGGMGNINGGIDNSNGGMSDYNGEMSDSNGGMSDSNGGMPDSNGGMENFSDGMGNSDGMDNSSDGMSDYSDGMGNATDEMSNSTQENISNQLGEYRRKRRSLDDLDLYDGDANSAFSPEFQFEAKFAEKFFALDPQVMRDIGHKAADYDNRLGFTIRGMIWKCTYTGRSCKEQE